MKLKHEGRKKEYILAKEAKDVSNAIIQMKASFFDFTKAKLIEEIQQSQDIDDVKNALAAKAGTYGEISSDLYRHQKTLRITFLQTAMIPTFVLKLVGVNIYENIKGQPYFNS